MSMWRGSVAVAAVVLRCHSARHWAPGSLDPGLLSTGGAFDGHSDGMTSLLPDEGERLTTGSERDLDSADSVVCQAVLVHASWAVVQGRGMADDGVMARGGWSATCVPR
jgi:hypothetical protein